MHRDIPPRFVLSSSLARNAIELNLRENQRDGVLAELVAKIPEIAANPEAQTTLLHALQERESLCSTGIGDGIALPHSRNALVGLVEHPIIVFGRHNQGVAFGSVDGSPARLFFLIVAPSVSSHLQILTRLSRLLRDPKLRQDLLVSQQPEQVIDLVRKAEEKM